MPPSDMKPGPPFERKDSKKRKFISFGVTSAGVASTRRDPWMIARSIEINNSDLVTFP